MEQVFYKVGCQLFDVIPDRVFKSQAITTQGLMVVGLDVSHDDTRRARFPSIATFIWNEEGISTNIDHHHLFTYFLPPKTELVPRCVTRDMMLKCLKQYKERHNGQLPQRIMFFRDSIGDTRYNMCLGSEMQGVWDAIKHENNGQMIPFELLSVAKRHNHRFHDISQRRSGGGMVYDCDVVTNERWQFMIRHSRDAQSTMYEVLVDGWGIQAQGPDAILDLYILLHAMTFCYTPAKKGVKLPAVIRWAAHYGLWMNSMIQQFVDNRQRLEMGLSHRPFIQSGDLTYAMD